MQTNQQTDQGNRKHGYTNSVTGSYTTWRTDADNAADFPDTEWPARKYGATRMGAKVHAMYRIMPRQNYFAADGGPDHKVTNPECFQPSYAPVCGTRNNVGTHWVWMATEADVTCANCAKRMGA